MTDHNGNTQTAYEYDLCDLEIRAKEAKIRAIEAQKALDDAKDVSSRNQIESKQNK